MLLLHQFFTSHVYFCVHVHMCACENIDTLSRYEILTFKIVFLNCCIYLSISFNYIFSYFCVHHQQQCNRINFSPIIPSIRFNASLCYLTGIHMSYWLWEKVKTNRKDRKFRCRETSRVKYVFLSVTLSTGRQFIRKRWDFVAGENGGCKTDCNSKVLIEKEKHFTSVIGDGEALSGAVLALSTSYFMTGSNPRYFRLPGCI